MDTIVVGVDGSEGARRALWFAAEEAALRGAHLEVVCAWEFPATAYAGWTLPPGDLRGEMLAGAEQIVREAVQLVEAEQPEVEVDGTAIESDPGHALLDRAREAILLVVGTRGHGGFERLVLGSVSTHVIHHARCPVVVVPPGR